MTIGGGISGAFANATLRGMDAVQNGVDGSTSSELNEAAKNLNAATKSSALKRLGNGAEVDARRMQNGANN